MKTKILFASLNFDGHFKPLTSLAKYLQTRGYDVRWYTGKMYGQYLENISIPHFPFQKAMEITQANMEEVLPERKKHKSMLAKLKFDIRELFIRQIPGHVEDVSTIYQAFPFDLVIADLGFIALPVIRETLQVPTISIGVTPLMSTSRDLPPYGMGMTPSYSFWGSLRQDVLRLVSRKLIFSEGVREMNEILTSYNLKPFQGIVFDIPIHRSDLFLQSAVPGFEYQRSDMNKNVRFLGALLPYKTEKQATILDWHSKLKKYKKVILVTQGTVEKDTEKILVPTLEAFKDSSYLVVATTGGSHAKELQSRYPQDNIIIKDFIDFDYIMPYADVFVSNGGYGGVMMAISHQLPLVVAGIHEGKNEVNARVGYFALGIDLKTEKPTAEQIQKAVEEVLANPHYKQNVMLLSEEFQQYDPAKLCAYYVEELLNKPVSSKEQLASRRTAQVVQS